MFLRHPSTLINPRPAAQAHYTRAIIKAQRALKKPIFLVPQVIIWIHRPGHFRPTLSDVVFGTADSPGAMRALGIAWLLYRWATGRGFSFSVLNAIINSVFSIVSETPLVPALNTPADHATNVAKAGNLVYHEPASGWYDKSELLLVKHSDDSVVLDVIGGPGTAAGSMITTAYSGLAAGTVYDWTVTYSNSSGTSGFAQRDFTTITP